MKKLLGKNQYSDYPTNYKNCQDGKTGKLQKLGPIEKIDRGSALFDLPPIGPIIDKLVIICANSNPTGIKRLGQYNSTRRI